MYWALFGQTELLDFETTDERFNYTKETGTFLFAMFSICAVIVGINMLIAMMNNSYELISVSGYNKYTVGIFMTVKYKEQVYVFLLYKTILHNKVDMYNQKTRIRKDP